LAAKIAASAFFVLGGTAAAEWLGPRFGSIVGSTPQLAILSLIFFTLEQGPAFAAESAFWTIPGMGAAVPVYLGYLAATRLIPGPRARSVAVAVSLGTATFVVGTLLLSALPLGPLTAVPFAAAVCLIASYLVRHLPDTATLRRGPTSIPLLAIRLAVSALTVLVVTSVAHLLGPKWSGLVVGFPVNGLPVIALLHARYGPDVIMPFIRMFPAGAFGICLFNLVASWTLVRIGLPATIALAYAVDVAYLAAVAWLRRPRPVTT
jgi:hypothetical protein